MTAAAVAGGVGGHDGRSSGWRRSWWPSDAGWNLGPAVLSGSPQRAAPAALSGSPQRRSVVDSSMCDVRYTEMQLIHNNHE